MQVGQSTGTIVDQLNREINAALADSRMKVRFADLGGTALALTPSQYGKLLADETENRGKSGPSSQYQAGVTMARLEKTHQRVVRRREVTTGWTSAPGGLRIEILCCKLVQTAPDPAGARTWEDLDV